MHMKTFILSSNRLIVRMERSLLGLSLALMVVLLASGVFCRYVLNDPLVWSESIAKLLIVWMTFIGTSISFAENNNIRVDSLVECFPYCMRRAISIMVDIFTVSVLGYMGYLGFLYFETTISSTSPILGISNGFFSFGMPIMFVFSVLHVIVNRLEFETSSKEASACY